MSTVISDINSVFATALQYILNDLPRGSKRQLAARIGVSTGHFSDILNGRRGTSEEQRRRLAEALGYPGSQYDDFMALGQALKAETEADRFSEEPDGPPGADEDERSQPDPPPLIRPKGGGAGAPRLSCREDQAEYGPRPPLGFEPGPRSLSGDELRARGFLAVPFSQEMKLAAGGGGTIPITEDEESSPVIVHGPSLGLRSAKNLQAFRVGGDSMEPLIAQNGIVLADLSRNDLGHLQEGAIYVLCWDRDEGECAVKRLRWAEKGRLLLIESEDRFYPPVIKQVREVVLIGQVIWAWREFKYK